MKHMNLLAALESNEDGNASPEIEYTVYGRLSRADVLQQAESSEKQVQANIDLEDSRGVKLRVRQVGENKYLMCAKKKSKGDDELSQTEVEQEITRDMFGLLISSAESVFYKTRYFFPVPDSTLVWEVDVFTTTNGDPHPWVKLDLEVPSASTPRPPLPFDLEEVIDSAPSEFTPQQKETLDALWKEEWPVRHAE